MHYPEERFAQGYNCAQAVLCALTDEPNAMRLASMLGGGLCGCGEVCGALSGALLALGLAEGSDSTDPAVKRAQYARGRALIEAFEARYGACRCADLRGGHARGVKRDPALKGHCMEYVRGAFELALESMRK